MQQVDGGGADDDAVAGPEVQLRALGNICPGFGGLANVQLIDSLVSAEEEDLKLEFAFKFTPIKLNKLLLPFHLEVHAGIAMFGDVIISLERKV